MKIRMKIRENTKDITIFALKLFFQFCRSYANWIESQVKALEKGHENLLKIRENTKDITIFALKLIFTNCAFAFTKIRHTTGHTLDGVFLL